MLTTLQHSFALRLTQPQQRQAYSLHQCGLCHALGNRYGLLFRLATSHELVLLNILTSAQLADEPVLIQRRCPLNPLFTPMANTGFAAEYAAAVAIELADAKFADDVQDSGGRDVAARLGRRLARRPQQAALRALEDLGVNGEALSRLSERQRQAEQDDAQDPAEPTARVSAALFAATARLAARPENVEPLAAIGAGFGAYIYLQDTYHDFARDMARGDYNPLRRFCQQSPEILTLAQAGLQWLLSRLETIQASMREEVPKLQLARHADLLAELLRGPIDKFALDLSRQTRQSGLSFRRWQGLDVLKAGLFMLPFASMNDLSSDCGSSSKDFCSDCNCQSGEEDESSDLWFLCNLCSGCGNCSGG